MHWHIYVLRAPLFQEVCQLRVWLHSIQDQFHLDLNLYLKY